MFLRQRYGDPTIQYAAPPRTQIIIDRELVVLIRHLPLISRNSRATQFPPVKLIGIAFAILKTSLTVLIIEKGARSLLSDLMRTQ